MSPRARAAAAAGLLLTLAACAGATSSGAPPARYGGDYYDPWRYDRGYRDAIRSYGGWSGGPRPAAYRPPVGR